MTKTERLQVMINNIDSNIADNGIKVGYYEYLATLETDEKLSASWKVEADKIKVDIENLQKSMANLKGYQATL